jgi:hypothetical protein
MYGRSTNLAGAADAEAGSTISADAETSGHQGVDLCSSNKAVVRVTHDPGQAKPLALRDSLPSLSFAALR